MPIPFGNIGTIIPEFFLHTRSKTTPSHRDRGFFSSTRHITQLSHLGEALRLNAMQVHTYLTAYDKQSHAFSKEQSSNLTALVMKANQLFDELNSRRSTVGSDPTAIVQLTKQYYGLLELYQRFLMKAKTMCREKWTQFNLRYMCMGIAIFVLSTIWLTLFLFAFAFHRQLNVFCVSFCKWLVCGAIGAVAYTLMGTGYSVEVLLTNITLAALIAGCIWIVSRMYSLNHSNTTTMYSRIANTIAHLSSDHFFAILCYVLYISGLFSNSFIVFESYVVQFLLLSCWIVFVWQSFQHVINYRKILQILSVGVLVRLFGDGTNFAPESIVNDVHSTTLDMLQMILPMLVIPVLLFIATPSRNLRRGSIIAICVVAVSSVMIVMFWIVQYFGLLDNAKPIYRVVPPQLVYLCCMSGVLAVLFSPTTAHIHKPQPQNASRAAIFSFLKKVYDKRVRSTVIGLNTSVFAGLLALYFMLCCPLILLLGPRAPFCLLCLIIVLYVIAIRHSHYSNSPTVFASKHSVVSIMEVLFVWFIGVRLFFSTGHENSFGRLQVSCSFIGFNEYNFVISGIMLMLNTFAGPILASLSVPLLVAFRHAQHQAPDCVVSSVSSNNEKQLHLASYTKPMLWFILFSSMRATISTINVYFQRRHLMVWAIFAPKYAFDMSSLLIGDLLSVVIALVLWWFHISVSSFIRNAWKSKIA